MNSKTPVCLVCGHTSDVVPLITVHYHGSEYAICPTHFPILIHQPEKLADKLPGIENLVPGEH